MQFGVNVNKLFHSLESNLEKVELIIIESVLLFCWCCLGNYYSNRNRAIDQRLMSATKNIRVEVEKKVEKAMVTGGMCKTIIHLLLVSVKDKIGETKVHRTFFQFLPSILF